MHPVRKAEHKTGQGCMPSIEQEAPLSPTNRTTHIHRLVQVPSYRPWSVCLHLFQRVTWFKLFCSNMTFLC